MISFCLNIYWEFISSSRVALGQRDCIAYQNVETIEYNRKLQDLMPMINAELPEIKVEYAGIYNPIMNMVDRSYIYGFSNSCAKSLKSIRQESRVN